MANFPRNEPAILALAQDMIAGLTANAATFPNPPVPPTGPPGSSDLTELMSSYIASRDAAVAARAAAERATTAKNADLGALVRAMKKDLRHAETIADFDDDLLKRIGWSGRRPRTELPPPGQCRALEAPRQGEGSILLVWKQPIDGGRPAAYKIERRRLPDGSWTDAGMSIRSEATLSAQARGVEWEYRVVAVNKSGEGQPSNTVMAVL